MADPLEIRRLSENTGAEIIDFDFRRGASPGSAHDWHAALDRYQLLLFRDAELDAESQVEFLESLGPALIENESGRSYQFVSNTHEEGILGDERFAFHSDHAFMPDPIDVLSLYAIEVPNVGTQTHFANGLAAARALPASLRERVEGLRARHIIDPAAESGAVPIRGPRLADDLPHAYHPILFPHPRTGEEILYLCEQQTDRIEDLDHAESRALIEALFEHLYSPRFMWIHEWREGDLLVWDNRALQHARAAIPTGASRTLRRVSVGGTPVYAFFRRHPKWGLDLTP
jgi:taurine dioxygenase